MVRVLVWGTRGRRFESCLPDQGEERNSRRGVRPDLAESGAVAVTRPCAICGRAFPVYRLASVVLDGHIAEVCPQDVATHSERIEVQYSPRTDQGAIQPSTSREVW